jgi:cytochrome c oxidase cbb3-type subunit 2
MPPLFGNRRQGPDLAQVGNRRNDIWNRLHLIAPRAVSPGSRMPAYAHLFKPGDTRGEALLAYLASLGADTHAERGTLVQTWAPAPGTRPSPAGARRFASLCAPCHGEGGGGDGPLAGSLGVKPIDFGRDAWRYVRGEDELLALMRIVKFGVPGTAMAGHEYLNDGDVFALALHVRSLHASVDGKRAP